MRKVNFITTSAVVAFLVTVLFLGSASVSASSTVLKKGMQGSEVTALQKDLAKLGYLSSEATGYYGDATEEAIKKLQKEYGYDADGVAGSTTIQLVNRLRGRSDSSTAAAGASVQSSSGVLKLGSEGSAVTELQKSLKALGFLSAAPTGYFGEATAAAVKKLQKKYGYEPDGVAGSSTLALVKKLASGSTTAAKTSTTATAKTAGTVKSTATSSTAQTSYKLPWFSKVSSIFSIGKVATVYDIGTGLSFKVKRTYGHNHADCEALTATDTKTMKKIFGGSWSWDRRAVIVSVGDVKIAASIAGMPHAGLDKYAANRTVSSRSGGFGRGENLDAVKGNNMNGVFDVHFYGSRTHESNRTDSQHQAKVKEAAKWAEKNY
jgi:peptidoglycan hydrolase-like protein with peptidoglycan-binding domain